MYQQDFLLESGHTVVVYSVAIFINSFRRTVGQAGSTEHLLPELWLHFTLKDFNQMGGTFIENRLRNLVQANSIAFCRHCSPPAMPSSVGFWAPPDIAEIARTAQRPQNVAAANERSKVPSFLRAGSGDTNSGTMATDWTQIQVFRGGFLRPRINRVRGSRGKDKLLRGCSVVWRALLCDLIRNQN